MVEKLSKYRSGIVITLISAISSVFVCQALCDLNIYSIKRNCNTICDVSDQVKKDKIKSYSSTAYDHNSGNGQDHHNHSEIEVSHQSNHHSKNDEDCCEDMTTKIFESFINQKTNIPNLEAKLFLIFDIEFPIYKISFENRLTDFYKFYSDSSPPIKGQKIIVFVQSFLL